MECLGQIIIESSGFSLVLISNALIFFFPKSHDRPGVPSHNSCICKSFNNDVSVTLLCLIVGEGGNSSGGEYCSRFL